MHFIENNFKTIQFSAFFTMEDKLETRSYRHVLPILLTKSNDEYKTKLSFNEHLEDLYGAYFRTKVEKYGNLSVLSMTLTIPNPKIVKDESLYDQALDLFKQTIFNRKFLSEDVFLDEKRNAVELYEGLKDRKRQYAQIKFFETFFEGDHDQYPLIGSLKSVKKMTYAGIQAYYQDFFKHNKMEIIINGLLDENMKSKAEKVFEKKMNHYQIVTTFRKPRAFKKVYEQTDTKQAIIMIGYTLPIYVNKPLYEASLLCDVILGETPESRLFQKIREEKGLCYDVSSSYDAYKGVLIVHAGVSIDKKQEAVDAMLELVNDMILHGVTKEELESAKSYLSHIYKTNTDSQSALTRRLLTGLLLNDPSTIEDRLNKILHVSLEDVSNALKHITLDTLYVLEEHHD